jgi:DNA-binding transcriptional LysR family regulator
VRLFQRSTRTVRLTEEGRVFHERCRQILDDLHDAEAMVSETAQTPKGRLRISVPTIGYRFLVPHLPEFHRRYPDVELDLDFNDRLVDIIDEGFDAVIRSGDLPDSRLMSRLLGPFRFVLCAAPGYIARHGLPETISALAAHTCVQFRFPTSGKLRSPPFTDGNTAQNWLTCSNMEALRAVTAEGLGLGYMPDFLARSALEDGSLLRIPLELPSDEGRFWVIWPSSRQLSPKIRVFVDFVCEHLFREPAQVRSRPARPVR